jgi:hypothetical protein
VRFDTYLGAFNTYVTAFNALSPASCSSSRLHSERFRFTGANVPWISHLAQDFEQRLTGQRPDIVPGICMGLRWPFGAASGFT